VKHNGDISWKDVIEIAKVMRPRSMARKMKGTVKEILGSAQSVGCTIEGKHPHDVIEEVDNDQREIPEYDPPREVA
jgi:large subunit ribosomal protein L12e